MEIKCGKGRSAAVGMNQRGIELSGERFAVLVNRRYSRAERTDQWLGLETGHNRDGRYSKAECMWLPNWWLRFHELRESLFSTMARFIRGGDYTEIGQRFREA